MESEEDVFVESPSSEDPELTQSRSARIRAIDPPRTQREIGRDYILRWLDGRFFQVLNVVALFLVIADGAFFFFLLMGWHAMCEPRTDCEPRNFWYNWSVQVLTGLFTYMVTVSLPWRMANFWHTIGCGLRKNTPGLDLYALPTKDIWFHIPLGRRLGIIIILLLNVFTQYANQTMRLIFYSYELQAEHGLAVTIFFVMSFTFAFLAFIWMSLETVKLRRANPGFFADGESPADMVKKHWNRYCCCMCGGGKAEDENSDAEMEITESELQYRHADPTTNSVAVFFGKRRAELRMLGIG